MFGVWECEGFTDFCDGFVTYKDCEDSFAHFEVLCFGFGLERFGEDFLPGALVWNWLCLVVLYEPVFGKLIIEMIQGF
ncbi:hypothetical protein ACSBR2_029587 [Camellia fascicularis]